MPRTSSIELPRILALGARRVLSRNGPRGVTYRAVAAESGVTVRSIQNRFGSIAGLLDHVANRGFVELADRVMHEDGRNLVDLGTPTATLTEALLRYERLATANPELHRLLFDAPAFGITPSPATRRAAADFVALFEAAARSEEVGHRRLAEVHGRIGLTLAGLGLGFEPRPLPAPPSDRSATATRRQGREGP